MAKKQKTEAKAGAPAKKGKTKSLIITLVIGAIVFAVTQYAFILVAIGLFPSFIANIVDRSPAKRTFQTVLACNLSGVLPYVGQLMQHGASLTAVQSKTGDLYVWTTMYIAAALGWLLITVLPRIAQRILAAWNERRIATLNDTQKKFIEEWGPEIKRQAEA